MPTVRTQLDAHSSLDASLSPTSGSRETGQSASDPSPRNHEAGRELPTVRIRVSVRLRVWDMETLGGDAAGPS